MKNKIFLCLITLTILIIPQQILTQQDPPRWDCCYQIWATGSNLGWATSLLRYTQERNRWVPADQTIVNNILRARQHVRGVYGTCSKMNLAWPNYLQRQSFLQRQVDYFRALPSKRRRGHVYLSIKDTYRWGDALKSQVKDTPPRDQIGKATCAEKYFELGFLIGYAAQSLKISQELLSYPFSDPRRRNWAPPVHHAISHLSRALIVLDEYFAVQTGTCVEIVDLRVKERIYDLVKTPVLTKNVMPMVEEVDAVWINMQNRIMLGCPGSGDDDDEANDGFSSDTGVTEAGESTEHPQMDQSRPVRSVEEAESLDFTGRYNLSDPKRSYQDYHGAVTFFANGRFKSWENPGSKPLAGSGGWSFDPKTKIFTIDWYDGGKFSGYVKGNTRDFVITGHWADGKPGRLRIHR